MDSASLRSLSSGSSHDSKKHSSSSSDSEPSLDVIPSSAYHSDLDLSLQLNEETDDQVLGFNPRVGPKQEHTYSAYIRNPAN